MEHRVENALTEQVIGAAYEVSNTLGTGFLEKVYERAMALEVKARGLAVASQVALSVQYKGSTIGAYYADLIIEGSLIVELKCVEKLTGEHVAQCLNYLRATGQEIALLINFQHPRVELRKVILNR